jgi:hypothetical protein
VCTGRYVHVEACEYGKFLSFLESFHTDFLSFFVRSGGGASSSPMRYWGSMSRALSECPMSSKGFVASQPACNNVVYVFRAHEGETSRFCALLLRTLTLPHQDQIKKVECGIGGLAQTCTCPFQNHFFTTRMASKKVGNIVNLHRRDHKKCDTR